MDAAASSTGDPGAALLACYDDALPRVYGYLLRRCGQAPVAEELTSETFLAAADATRRTPAPRVDVPWLIGVARHKLVDHWRRQAREERQLRAVEETAAPWEGPWDAKLNAVRAHAVLESLGPHHRGALVLRYLDGLSVPDVADALGRSVHATEALLVRARTAFRRAYEEGEDGD
jgi:RNA polymerase sigma-70 factor (ECF subfamily)